MTAKLYVLPGSHPCAAVEAALKLKGLEYRRVDLLPLTQRAIGPFTYRGSTVPGLRLDGERLTGSRTIMRRLDELVPDPALYPAELGRRKAVLEAEAWGDEVLQAVPRRIIDALFLRRPRAMEAYVGDAKLPLPRWMLRPSMPAVARLMAIANKAGDDHVRGDLVELPAQLDRIDNWVAEGVLGGAQPNAADLQIGSSIRLLQSFGDVAPMLEGRSCTRLTRYFPPSEGTIEAGLLPADWLAAAEGAAPRATPEPGAVRPA